jgi:hypothetical protein
LDLRVSGSSYLRETPPRFTLGNLPDSTRQFYFSCHLSFPINLYFDTWTSFRQLVYTLLRHAGIEKRTGDLYMNRDFINRARNIARGLKGVENVYTQHQPLLTQTMENIAKGRLRDIDYPFVGSHYAPAGRYGGKGGFERKAGLIASRGVGLNPHVIAALCFCICTGLWAALTRLLAGGRHSYRREWLRPQEKKSISISLAHFLAILDLQRLVRDYPLRNGSVEEMPKYCLKSFVLLIG